MYFFRTRTEHRETFKNHRFRKSLRFFRGIFEVLPKRIRFPQHIATVRMHKCNSHCFATATEMHRAAFESKSKRHFRERLRVVIPSIFPTRTMIFPLKHINEQSYNPIKMFLLETRRSPNYFLIFT